jgi:hypothetical protein
VPGNTDHRQLSQTRTFGGDFGEDVSGCHPDLQSFILFSFYVYSLVSLLWLVYIVKPLYYLSSVLKSTSFTPDSFPQSFLLIPDLYCPSEIRIFRCYKGTAHKLRPSPFGTHLQSPESIILLSEPNSIHLNNTLFTLFFLALQFNNTVGSCYSKVQEGGT